MALEESSDSMAAHMLLPTSLDGSHILDPSRLFSEITTGEAGSPEVGLDR